MHKKETNTVDDASHGFTKPTTGLKNNRKCKVFQLRKRRGSCRGFLAVIMLLRKTELIKIRCSVAQKEEWWFKTCIIELTVLPILRKWLQSWKGTVNAQGVNHLIFKVWSGVSIRYSVLVWPVNKLFFLRAIYRGWTRAGEERVQRKNFRDWY